MNGLPDRGHLSVLPLPALLLLLHQERFSGRLRLSRDAIVRDVAFGDGRVVRAMVPGHGAALCSRLVATGRLSPKDAARVAAQAPKLGGSEERTLLALKLLTPRTLYLALREHEREVLLECFSWPDATFELAPGPVPPGDAVLLDHDPVELAHAGMAAHWGTERALSALRGAAHHYARLGRGFEPVAPLMRQLQGFEPLRARLDGRTTLADAIAAARHPGAAAAAFVLDALGALTHLEEPLSESDNRPIAHAETDADGPEIEIVVSGVAGGASPAGSDAARATPDPTANAYGSAATVRRELQEQYRDLAGTDHYALLGLARTADVAAVRRAYTAAAKRFHPDALVRLGLADVREIANEVFARISQAHAVLSDPEQRRDYDESLEGCGADEAQRHASAQTFHRKGEVLLRKGSFGDALQFLRPAVELCPDKAIYRSTLGWALFKSPTPDLDAARAELERAVTIDPKDPGARERLATVLRALGKSAEASEQLAKARELEGRTAQSR